MIIGINGYIGSGKDTVGSIIQKLTAEPRDDLGAGYKNTWEIKKFAAKLKQIASLMTGIPIEKFEDQEFKKTELGPEWNRMLLKITNFAEKNGVRDESKMVDVPMTVREFLQKLGTEAIRNGLHTNAWVNALFADYIEHSSGEWGILDFGEPGGYEKKGEFKGGYPNWIITDCRFPNEAQAIKDRGGLVFRIDRELANAGSTHASEISLDGWKFDAVIPNNGTIEELVIYVRSILKYYEII